MCYLRIICNLTEPVWVWAFDVTYFIVSDLTCVTGLQVYSSEVTYLVCVTYLSAPNSVLPTFVHVTYLAYVTYYYLLTGRPAYYM